MPRVKPAAPSRMQDRPGRWKLLWRRQRKLRRPALLGAAVLALMLVFAIVVRVGGSGASFDERFGNLTARLGFNVQKLVIEGRQKTPEPMLRAALGITRGDPILTFGVADARARIETINWVQSATVERRLPDTILVHLVERRPFAVWQHNGKFVLIDRDGNTVTDADVAAFASQVPLVVGAGAPHAAAALLDTLSTQPTLLARMVAAVRVGERRWNLRMNNGADVELPEDAEAPALARLAQLETQYKLLDRPLRVIDMRLPDRLVLRPLPATPAQATPAQTATGPGG
ncbi:MAG: cell division protein FtsQ/DivIB, partial [Rhodospirillales bacterium]|nr:cell division protein FtsQ/DivIB [Rhodospirillales bacterium]